MSWRDGGGYPQKSSAGASRWEEEAGRGCLITNNQPEMGLEMTARIIHHVPWEHH
jgi:hypothetical protein